MFESTGPTELRWNGDKIGEAKSVRPAAAPTITCPQESEFPAWLRQGMLRELTECFGFALDDVSRWSCQDMWHVVRILSASDVWQRIGPLRHFLVVERGQIE
jgi:hypothetical protein